MKNNYLIKEGTVVLVEGKNDSTNEADALRVKVRLKDDGNVNVSDLPWCFPLLPKSIQSVPKEGECVLVITSCLNNNFSNRFYIGPVISQPQYNGYCPYDNGNGPALSLLQGGNDNQILKKISKFSDTKNAFPNYDDVAIIGRDTEDVILKDGEINLRCGIRSESNDNTDDLKGKVILNTISPAYIQLKYKQSIAKDKNQRANSLVNIVGDKINLMSNQVNVYENGKDILNPDDMDSLMSKLHRLPYGDVLVKTLEIMRKAIINHVHNFPGTTPPIPYESVLELQQPITEDKLLSKDVRIS